MKYGPIYLAVIIALCIRFFIISVHQMPNSNMSPTLMSGDYIMTFKNEFGVRSPFSNSHRFVREPVRGELVVYTKNAKTLIRRVVALPGEQVSYEQNRLKINENECLYTDPQRSADENLTLQTENCAGLKTQVLTPANRSIDEALLKPVTLGEREYLVLSDNRQLKNNSHVIEVIKFDQIIGKPWLIWMSYGSTQDFISVDKSVRWNRILTKLN